jgi:hypothetical protein
LPPLASSGRAAMRAGDPAAQSRDETEGELRQELQDFDILGRLIEKD